MKTALFGGTFDPIHSAHLTVAREVVEQFGLDQVLFVPASHPPHKQAQTVADYKHRYRMVELACDENNAFVPSRLEEGQEQSYSVLTIERLQNQTAPSNEIFFLIGADAFAEIQTWFRWQDVVQRVQFIVVTRPGHDYDVPPGARVHRLDTLALPVSSSEIRKKLAAGDEAVDLPASVLRYIKQHGLYVCDNPAAGSSGKHCHGKS